MIVCTSDEEDSASARTVSTNRGHSQPPVLLVNGSSPNQPSPRYCTARLSSKFFCNRGSILTEHYVYN